MLQAADKDGRSVTLAMVPKEKLAELRKGGARYYCPTCGELVIAKAGPKVTPHFAHKARLDCPSAEGGEGAYHEMGKLQLYQWLSRQGLEVGLETFHPEIRQRSDIFLALNEKRIAIEYQCAAISPEEIDQRTAGYRRAGITPIWIAGARRFVRYNHNTFRLDAFLKKLIHRFSAETPLTLYFYCPDTGNMIIVQHIRIIKGNKAAGSIRVFPLRRLVFTGLFKTFPYGNDMIRAWHKEKCNLRMRPPGRSHGSELSWWHWLYAKGLHPQSLPSEIFLPVSSQLLMKTSSWNWQSRLYLEIIHPLQIGQTFTVSRCERLLSSHFHPDTPYPLLASIPSPIVQYLDCLTLLGYLRSIPDGAYEKLSSLQFHKSAEEACNSDEEVLRKIFARDET